MRKLLLLFCLLAAPLTAQENRGFFDRLLGTDATADDAQQTTMLEGLLGDQLSSAGRRVTVRGFSGALSGRATLDTLSFADEQGTWFTLTDAVLDWDRAALFRGELNVTELSAESITLTRLPQSDPAPTPEASSFELPSLPISVQIGRLAANRVTIGEDVFGLPASLSVKGALSLADGAGTATLALEKTDGTGALAFDGSYNNETQNLRIGFTAREGAGGILATLMDLPGKPSLDMVLSSDAPLSNFTANLRLATNGTERLAGTATITETPDQTRQIALDISGDIAPVFAPEYRPFFGDQIALSANAITFPDGRIDLPTFTLKAEEIALQGALTLAADGTPQALDITGTIAPANGTDVLLPFAENLRIGRADLAVQLVDGAGSGTNPTIAGQFEITRLNHPDLAAERLSLQTTSPLAGNAPLTTMARFAANGVDAGTAITQALGQTIAGTATIAQNGKTLSLSPLVITANDLDLTANARIDETGDISADFNLAAQRLENFSALAGRTLSGQAESTGSVRFAPLTQAFTANVSAKTTDLTISEPRADAILQGDTNLAITAIRDETGLRITLDQLENKAANLTGRANLTSGQSTAQLSGTLTDTALLIDGLTGPSTIDLTGNETPDRDWNLAATLATPALTTTVDGRLVDPYGNPSFEGAANLNADDLSVLSELAGRPLAGDVKVTASGNAAADLSFAQLDLNLEGQNLQTGTPDLDQLLRGEISGALKFALSDDNHTIEIFRLQTPSLTASADGNLAETLNLSARLANIAPFAPGLSGPLAVSGTVEDQGQNLALSLVANGPGSARATLRGTTAKSLDTARLALDGTAPLALANRFIAPRSLAGTTRFDLALNGPPALENLSGQISTASARLATPTLLNALENIAATITLSNGTATLNTTANVETGGQLTLEGPVTLTPPFRADLRTSTIGLRLTDPNLYETTANGTITLTGSLAGGARIAGTVTLGETNIRIPNSSLGGAGAIPEVVHLNEPPPVRGTRQRAGLLASGTGSGGKDTSAAFPLDITVNAPNRIFVRGRGLDSEFGGALAITGTTAAPVPLGQFDLVRGRLDILGRRLTMERAGITIQGEFVPFLDILAETTAEDTKINVAVTGPADNPEITFTSDPDLPQEEVLARLIFGRGLETLSPLQAARLALAVRTLAGGGGEGIVGNIRNRTGLSDFDVTTDEDGNAAVRAGAYLGENLYSDVIVNSEGETQLNLNLDLTPSVTLRGGVSNDGETSVGIFFERDY